MNFAWLIYLICLVVMAVIYIVACKARFKRLQIEFNADLDDMRRDYEHRREKWLEDIYALKNENEELRAINDCLDSRADGLEGELMAYRNNFARHDGNIEIPPTSDRMLICSVTKKGEKRINIAWYEDGVWHGNGNLDNVIAWRPLPELPEFEDPAEGGEE